MKKIILTSLLVLGLATASQAATITGGSSTTIGNAKFNASKAVTLDVSASLVAFGVAGKHLNAAVTYGLTSDDPIMKKSETLVEKGTALADGDAVSADGTIYVLDSSFKM